MKMKGVVFLTLFYLVLTCSMDVLAEETISLRNNSREKVMLYVKKAQAYIEKHGKEKAMLEFNKKSGEFSEGSSYIFALDYESVYLATINYPDLVGINQFSLNDPVRTSLVQEEIAKAKSGGGWIKQDRLKKNPNTGKHECKASYILPMKGEYLIGSGYYYPPDKQGNCRES